MALGVWDGQNTSEEREEESRRLGAQAYRFALCNALLGMVQAQAVLADQGSDLSASEREAGWQEQMRALGADGDPEVLMGFLRWQTLRLGIPLGEIAGREQTGPIPLAAAQTVQALQQLLEVIGNGQRPASAQAAATPRQLQAARDLMNHSIRSVEELLDRFSEIEQLDDYTPGELDGVEHTLLAAAAELAPLDEALPNSGTATLVLCGALAPLAEGLVRGAGPLELHDDVARLGAAAATFLIALSPAGPTAAELDSARQHVIHAVLRGERGISQIPIAELDSDRWLLRAVAAIGNLMGEGASGPPVTERAYASRVTGHALEALTISGAWLAHAARGQTT